MLILTRRVGDAVVIGENEINLTILGVQGTQVRIGFLASKDISIHRHEIYNRIQSEKNHTNSEDALSLDVTIIDQIEGTSEQAANSEITH